MATSAVAPSEATLCSCGVPNFLDEPEPAPIRFLLVKVWATITHEAQQEQILRALLMVLGNPESGVKPQAPGQGSRFVLVAQARLIDKYT